jgi:hypothetical protein
MTINEQSLNYKLDDGIGHRARIGLIALPDDETIEHELRMIFDLPGVACFVNRLPCAATITPDSLKSMESEIRGMETRRIYLLGFAHGYHFIRIA